MKNYELASKELYEFEEALKKAKDLAMEVEWFAAFTDAIRANSVWDLGSDTPSPDNELLKKSIEIANKKLGM